MSSMKTRIISGAVGVAILIIVLILHQTGRQQTCFVPSIQ